MKKRFVYLLSLIGLCLCACNGNEYVRYSKYVGVSYNFDDKAICHIKYVNDYEEIYKYWSVRLTGFYVEKYSYNDTFIIATKRNNSNDYYLIVSL